MSEFKNYHPLVNFLYFLSVIIFSCVFMHPFCLLISVVCSIGYSVVLKGSRAIKKGGLYTIPLVATTALINMMFNHEGVTILAYLPGGNPLTLESVVYGFAAGAMIMAVIYWFLCFNEIMTSDKFIYLFGKILPAFSLILTITFRLVPRFISKFKTVSDAQKCIGNDMPPKGIVNKIKHISSIMSVMIGWTLENSIETADSMKSRGYGLSERTAFSVFKFAKRDVVVLVCLILLDAYVIFSGIAKSIRFQYFPAIVGNGILFFESSAFFAYFLLFVMPLILETKEALKWKYINSKM